MDSMEKLKQEYVASLAQKRETIRITLGSVMRALKISVAPDWKALEFVVHKFAGSSGTYGFKELSVHARELEDRIIGGEFAAEPAKKTAAYLHAWLERLDTLLDGAINGKKAA